MGGLWSRSKVWDSGEVLTASDLNGEFENVRSNQVPEQFDDYSSNASTMRTVTDPGESGSESLATSLAGEIERIRYAIKDIKDTTYWYETPSTNLSILSNTAGDISVGFEFEGKYDGASSTTDVLAKLINRGAIINAFSLSSADVASGDFGSTNVKFGKYSYSLGSGNILAVPSTGLNPFKGSVSAHYRNLAAGDYIAYNPLLGLELYLDGTGLQTWKITEKGAATESTKTTKQVQGSVSRAGDTDFQHISAKWRTNDENGTGTDLLEMELDGSDEGTQLTSQNIDISQNNGGVWFLGSKRNDPTWDHFYSASGLPTAHSDAWTATGTTSGNSVSGGILNISGQGSTDQNNYSKTNNIDLTQFTLEFKMKANDISGVDINTHPLLVQVRDDSLDRSFSVVFFESSVTLGFGAATQEEQFLAVVDTSQYHIYRVTSSGSPDPTIKLYIDGVLVFSATNTYTDPDSGDSIVFGDITTSAGVNSDSDWEYIAYHDAGATPPVAASSQGELDSVGVISGLLSDGTINILQTNRISDVFSFREISGPYLPLTNIYDRENAVTTTSTTFTNIGSNVYYVAGDGETEFSFNLNVPLSKSSAGAFGVCIDVNDDNDGETAPREGGGSKIEEPVTNQLTTMFTQRAVVLPVGLNEIRPQYIILTGGGTLSVEGEEWAIFGREIIKKAIL